MGPTPLYDALRAFADENTLRLHMPGHKGRTTPLPELNTAVPLDFTELPPTGDLFDGTGPISTAQRLWANAVGMEECLFLTGGSTQGMLTALTLATTGGASGMPNPAGQGGILLDRGSHRSAYHALALLDLAPVYLERPWLDNAGVPGPVAPQSVEKHLENHPDIKTVCITSPTYYGVLSDIPAIAQVVHDHGGTLVVDAAHGAHLPFLGYEGYAAADLVVASAHKTLPALGQSALLFARGFSHGALRRSGSLYGSSSPSYLLMASLDGARAWMEDEGKAAYAAVCAGVARLRAGFPSLSHEDAPMDGARFVLKAADGFGVQEELERLGIYPEMADKGHVVFIFTCADGGRDFQRLERALRGIFLPSPPPKGGTSPKGGGSGLPVVGGTSPKGGGSGLPVVDGTSPCMGLPPAAQVVLSPRVAQFAPCETVVLRQAEGRIAACQIAPYPPGVPILAPGERIGKKHLAYLGEIGYNMEQDIQVIVSDKGV